jgi:transcriptional regulator with XRE-family HTH domain
MICYRCDGAELLEKNTSPGNPYRYKASGLSNVYLVGIKLRVCPKCHSEVPVIPRMADLQSLLAHLLLEKPEGLIGEELRFLRKHIGLSGVEFAARIQIDASTLSRIENDQQPMGKSTDKLARAVVIAGIEEEKEEERKEELTKLLGRGEYLEAARKREMHLTCKQGKWREGKTAA